MPGSPVFGLVDADRDNPADNDHVLTWPVAMVENLLLTEDAIYAALVPFGTQTSAVSPTHVREILQRIAGQRREEEIQLRIKRHLPIGRLDISAADVSRVDIVAAEELAKWLEKMHALDVAKLTEDATAEVDEIVANGTQLERFHGKRILHALYNELGVASCMSRAGFALDIAARAAGAGRTMRLTTPAVNQIRLYFPSALAPLIRELGSGGADALAAECEGQHRAWQAGQPSESGRVSLRERVFAFGRSLDDAGRLTIARLASEIGTA